MDHCFIVVSTDYCYEADPVSQRSCRYAVFLILNIDILLLTVFIALWHKSMWGFNVTENTFPYDNRPVVPLYNMTFEQWWFHGHLDYPPNPGDYFELPVGQAATAEIACSKSATSSWESSEGGNVQEGDNPCPNSPLSAIHTNGINDVKGCALAIAYKSDVQQVQPEDFTVFSVNQTCVWTRFTEFQVPARMPPCPEGGCTCGFFWIHSVRYKPFIWCMCTDSIPLLSRTAGASRVRIQ